MSLSPLLPACLWSSPKHSLQSLLNRSCRGSKVSPGTYHSNNHSWRPCQHLLQQPSPSLLHWVLNHRPSPSLLIETGKDMRQCYIQKSTISLASPQVNDEGKIKQYIHYLYLSLNYVSLFKDITVLKTATILSEVVDK